MKICDVKPTDAVRIRIENVPRAKDYKYFIGTTPDTASMTLLDTSTKKTFVYEGLKEGAKYFFPPEADQVPQHRRRIRILRRGK